MADRRDPGPSADGHRRGPQRPLLGGCGPLRPRPAPLPRAGRRRTPRLPGRVTARPGPLPAARVVDRRRPGRQPERHAGGDRGDLARTAAGVDPAAAPLDRPAARPPVGQRTTRDLGGARRRGSASSAGCTPAPRRRSRAATRSNRTASSSPSSTRCCWRPSGTQPNPGAPTTAQTPTRYGSAAELVDDLALLRCLAARGRRARHRRRARARPRGPGRGLRLPPRHPGPAPARRPPPRRDRRPVPPLRRDRRLARPSTSAPRSTRSCASSASPRPLVPAVSTSTTTARATFELFRLLRRAHERLGPDACDTYVISMTEHASDVLAVLAMARDAGVERAARRRPPVRDRRRPPSCPRGDDRAVRAAGLPRPPRGAR